MPRTKKEVKREYGMGKGGKWYSPQPDRGRRQRTPEVRGAGIKEDPELLRGVPMLMFPK